MQLCFAPIGHRQERGDYQESWQPARISDKDLFEAQDMAESNRSNLWCRIRIFQQMMVYSLNYRHDHTIPEW
jgi:formate-dependent phosphoribosylglycinamide formyltransferase (GAR transformylase)